MKVRLLKKIRKICVLYKRGNEYKYVCYIPCDGDVWFDEIEWTTDKQKCIDKRREMILKLARLEYKPVKEIL